ncbi:hypothetical protein B9Z65_1826 [Elsinoe australis]|uniref:Uncharacterized protein n=1 Tax=Elsinoe australis TaxID=40998 RepID=A0A2P7YL02_9PEZI|nr:hypothetical protein B9Z65_1826 [Elsinoe australis]
MSEIPKHLLEKLGGFTTDKVKNKEKRYAARQIKQIKKRAAAEADDDENSLPTITAPAPKRVHFDPADPTDLPEGFSLWGKGRQKRFLDRGQRMLAARARDEAAATDAQQQEETSAAVAPVGDDQSALQLGDDQLDAVTTGAGHENQLQQVEEERGQQ